MEEKPTQQPNLCEECKTNPSKYKCPGCNLRSCSLPCVNSHKQRTNCTGKRPTTNFVPISQFDDNLILSDYNMLEDVKRIADSAQRTRIKLCGYSNFRLTRPLKNLRGAAASRRTKIIFLSNGMSKRVTNRTYYNTMKKFISWTIEWRFNSTDVVLVDHGVNENTILSSVIKNHLKPGPWHHPLRQFCDENLDSLKFFIRTYPKGPKSPFRKLDINAPICKQLANIVILEYPVIHVYLPSHSYDFKVINDTISDTSSVNKPSSNHDYPSPKGVTFKEEEIEDDYSPDPHVLDLMNHGHEKSESYEDSKDSERAKRVKRSFSNNDAPDIMTTEDNNIGTKSCIEQLEAIGDIDFEFETGLMELYSDIGNNGDSFFDFDGILGAEKGEEFLVDEELEEGEIA